MLTTTVYIKNGTIYLSITITRYRWVTSLSNRFLSRWFICDSMNTTCCQSQDADTHLVGSTSKLMCSGVVMTPLNKGSSSFCRYAAPYTWHKTTYNTVSGMNATCPYRRVLYVRRRHFWLFHDGRCACVFYLETEGHYFAGQAVSSEESLHGVGQLHLFREHVPQQLVK